MSKKPSPAKAATTLEEVKVSALPRRRFFDDMPDKGLFGFVAVFGFAVITTLKLYGYNSDLVAVMAVILMVGYGVIAYRIPAVALRLDRLGDNFYYLGFTYTLASLSAALIQLRASPEIEAILGSFGIALVTTIVGVAGRVLFTQMRGEIDEVEEATRRNLLESSEALKAKLDLSLRDFETFHKKVQQISEETLNELEERNSSEAQRVAKAAEAAASKITNAFKANEDHANALMQTVEKIILSVDELSGRLKAVDLPTKRLEDQFTSFGEEVERSLKRVVSSLDDMTERLKLMKPPAEALQNQIQSFGEGLEARLSERLASSLRKADQVASRRRFWIFGSKVS